MAIVAVIARKPPLTLDEWLAYVRESEVLQPRPAVK